MDKLASKLSSASAIVPEFLLIPPRVHLVRATCCAALLASLVVASDTALAQRRSFALGDGPWDYQTYEQDTGIRVSVVTKGLSHPWSMAFLPGTASDDYPLGDVLISEREGRLRLLRQGQLLETPVADLSGLSMDILFDLALHPDFETNGLVYLTYMKQAPAPDGSDYWATTALARGRYDAGQVTDISDIFVADAWSINRGSDASRIVFGPDGSLYMSSSHRRDPVGPQRPDSHVGKVLRLTDDGSPAPGNPFADRDQGQPEVFSYGHRTVLGLTVHPETGEIWEAENGPQGGDEVNVLRPGLNYGWPEVTFGRDYDGSPVSTSPWLEGTEAPELAWIPSITVSGMAFYTGDKFPAWHNNLFVGAMTTGRLPGTGHIERIVFNENGEQRREELLNDLQQRVRDIRLGPDGLLYLLTDENAGAMLRIEPIDVPSINSATLQTISQDGTPLFPRSDCDTCHTMETASIGPSWRQIAGKYAATEANLSMLANNIIEGSEGVWGEVPMLPHSGIDTEEAIAMVRQILELVSANESP